MRTFNSQVYNIKYYGIDIEHTYRSAQFMVINRITLEDTQVGFCVIDKYGRYRLFSDSVIQAGKLHNTEFGDFYIRFNGTNIEFDYPNNGKIPTIAKSISAFGLLEFEDSIEEILKV